mgnify:CR=1 FL=1
MTHHEQRSAPAAQQLVRYEALVQLLEEIQTLDDIAGISQQVVVRWKYFANVASWRLVLVDDGGFLVIDGVGGEARIAEVPVLSGWDEHHWRAQRPTSSTASSTLPPPCAGSSCVSTLCARRPVVPVTTRLATPHNSSVWCRT